MKDSPEILVLSKPTLFDELFSHEAAAELQTFGNVTRNLEERDWDSAELASRIAGTDIVVTGWGTPTFTDEVMASADALKLIAHTAGSIKRMLAPPIFASEILVTHAASAIAPAVAELNILLILMSLRQIHRLDGMLKRGEEWDTVKGSVMGQELAGQRVGVVGAGYTGRCLIELLNAFGADVWVYDPYLSPQRSIELMAKKVETADEIFAECPIVSMQTPPTEETYRMVGAQQLRLLQDGAVFVNTSRSHVLDEHALLAELESGRITAALDVFDDEPLPVDSPFRALPNVIITPHIAGHSKQARRRQGQEMVDEIRRFLHGEPLRYAVTADMLAVMA